MRYLSILLLIGVTLKVNGQQINPVPDYIFRNQMSVGRNAPTDTSAYFSIGPRYGATRGFMPPMVTDTASVTGTKRNGLLIYSIQRNSFLYWDSTGMRWSRIAANLDTLLLSTRAWRQKGIDSVNAVNASGTGISGYMTRWSGTKTMDTSQIFQNSAGEVLFGGTTDNGNYRTQINGFSYINSGLVVGSTATFQSLGGITIDDSTGTLLRIASFRTQTGAANTGPSIYFGGHTGVATMDAGFIDVRKDNATSGNSDTYMAFRTRSNTSGVNERMRISPEGEVYIGSTSDLGAYTLQVSGNILNMSGQNVLNATSGETLIGSSIDIGNFKAQVNGNAYVQGGLSVGSINTLAATRGVIIDDSSGVILRVATYREVTSAADKGPTIAFGVSSGGFPMDGGFIDVKKANSTAFNEETYMAFRTRSNTTGIGERMRISGDGAVSLVSDATASGIVPFTITRTSVSSTDAVFTISNGTNTAGQFLPTFTAVSNFSSGGLTIGGLFSAFITNGSADDIGLLFAARTKSSSALTQGWITSFRNFTTDHVRIAHDGNVVLQNGGTFTNAGYKLDVQGTMRNTGNAFFNTSSGESLFGTTSDAGTYRIQVSGNGYFTGSLTTGAPTGGTAQPWKLGTVATVSPTSPNRTIEVEINGTTYYLHAKTTND